MRAHWGQPLATAGPFVSAFRFLDLVGQHCLARPMNCIGDTQDADYQIGPSLRIDDGEVIAVVGTLGTATGNATYVSLSVNRFEVLMGVANLNDAELAGTAAPFAGALQNDARLFYVHYAARDCTGLDPWLELPTTLVPAGEVIKFLQRNYIFPARTTIRTRRNSSTRWPSSWTEASGRRLR